jgi:hypothetical protein
MPYICSSRLLDHLSSSLRNEAKWNAHLATMHGQRGGDATEGVQAEGDPTLPSRMERPMGRDRA